MKTTCCLTILATFLVASGLQADNHEHSASSNLPVTQDEQQALTPEAVLKSLMDGNSRFIAGDVADPNIKARVKASSTGQFPEAVILSCLDSRVPAEMVFDRGIGDVFVGRVAGNIENDDLLGSMEFATALAGAKLVFVLGHTGCGAVQGACAGAEMGHLTGLLEQIQPAIEMEQGFEGEDRSPENAAFVNAVAAENVVLTMQNIREKSEILRGLEESGDIMIVGGMYDLGTGQVTLIEE